MKRMKRFIFAMLVTCLFATLAFAQSTVGRLNGTVSGPDGLLPGATVTVTDNQTGKSFTTTSNESGGYQFEQLTFGTYTLKVTASGFKTYVANNLKVDANQTYTLNPKLELGDVTAEVTVQAGAEIINSSNAELSTTVSPKQVLDLPINGRNPLSLINLQAGVNVTASNHINGQRTASTSFTRDGINVQDNYIRTGGFVQDRPTVDDTGEFTVTTQNADASLGSGGSAQIQLVTPRGGSGFHGAVFIYNRNSAFSANTFGNNASGVDKPFLNRNQYGGKLSGPLPLPGFGEGTPMFFKDKGFFFFSYERFQLNQTTSATTRVLLPQFRDGTFTYTDSGGTQQTINVLTGAGLDLATPGNAALFANAQGVLPGVDSTIQSRILDRMPTAGNSTVQNGGLTQSLLFNVRGNTVRDTFTSRIDAEINDKHSLYGVFRYVDNAQDRPDIEIGFDEIPFASITSQTRFFVGAWRSVWGSNLTNEFRFSYSDNNPFFNQSPQFPTDFVIAGLPLGLTDPNPSFQEQGRTPNQYTLQDNASYSFGNHTMRFGGEYVSHIVDAVTNGNRVPIYTISNTNNGNTPFLSNSLFPGGISGTDQGRANSLRYFLGGIIGGGTVAANFQGPTLGPVLGTSRVKSFRYQTAGSYFTDSWRIRPNLTLNLGVRWDYYSPLENPDQVYIVPNLEGAEDFDTMRTNLLDPTGQYDLVGVNSGDPGRFFKPDLDNFLPVLSVAWSPRFEKGPFSWLFGKGGQTVIRGGFRMSAINDEYIQIADDAAGANRGLNFTVSALQNGSAQLNARFNNLPAFVLPAFQNPPITFASVNNASTSFFQTVWGINPNLEMQTNYQYNFGIQRELGWNTAFEIRYVGGHSNNMARAFDFNQVQINNNNFLNDFLTARNNCRVARAAVGQFLDQGCSANDLRGVAGLPGQVFLNSATSAIAAGAGASDIRTQIAAGNVGQAVLRYLIRGLDNFRGTKFRENTNAGPVDFLSNAGKYRYNSLQVEIRRRFSDGLQFQANYTFQKTLANALADTQARFEPFLDFNNQDLEYSRVDYDRTHTFNINANYELPFGKGKPFLNQGGIVDKIFGGFQLTAIMNISSGAPISIKDINGTLNRTTRSNRQTANSSLTESQIKDLVGVHIDPSGTIYYIDPSVIGPNGSATNGNLEATADARFPGQVFYRVQPGETGTLQRAFLNGPWYYNMDVGIIKNVKFGERFRAQFRAEAFNVLNTTNWFIAENTGTFNVGSTTFGQIPIANTFAPRIMQFAFRFEF